MQAGTVGQTSNKLMAPSAKPKGWLEGVIWLDKPQRSRKLTSQQLERIETKKYV